MLTPAILLFVLIVATAFIAYWSDNLGKKLGKKRISLFGLRPRQTATIITIGSSQLIMLVTLLFLLGIYAPLRHALLYYDTERARNRELVRSNEGLEQRQKGLRGQIKATRDQLEETRQGLTDAKSEANQARGDARQAHAAALIANAGATTARASAAAAKNRESAARNAERVARRGETQAQQSAKSARLQFTTTNTRLTAARIRLARIEVRLQQADLQVQQAAARLKKTGFRLKQVGARLNQTRQNLKETRTNLVAARNLFLTTSQDSLQTSKDLIELTAQYDQQRKEYDAQRIAYNQQKADLQTLRQQAAELQKQFESSLAVAAIAVTGPTMVTNEETLAEKTIDARQDASEIDRALRELMDAARQRVRKIAADSGLDPNRNPVSLRLVSRPAADLEEGRILNLLTGFLTNATTPVSVRVIAARNHAMGEGEIVAQLVTVPVRAAFAAGETIATATISARQTDAQIFNQLLALLNAGQRVAEAEHGVEPPLSREMLFYAPGTNERIFEALRRISALNAPARVRLNAATNASTAEPLRVTFAVDRTNAAPDEPAGVAPAAPDSSTAGRATIRGRNAVALPGAASS